MYYQLDTDGNESVYMGKKPRQNSHITLSMGMSLDVKKDEIDLPFEYEMSSEEGEEVKFHGWYPGSHLMQQRFIETLQKAGVNNLQIFPAHIVREGTKKEVPGFSVVNIVGCVSCAVMEESKAEPFIGNVFYFQDLVIDPKRVGDLLMFRVEESPMIVLVHDKVADAIRKAGFPGMVLEPATESSKKKHKHASKK
jgi:hypothetical protein